MIPFDVSISAVNNPLEIRIIRMDAADMDSVRAHFRKRTDIRVVGIRVHHDRQKPASWWDKLTGRGIKYGLQ